MGLSIAENAPGRWNLEECRRGGRDDGRARVGRLYLLGGCIGDDDAGR